MNVFIDTLVDGVRVESVELKPGDPVWVGGRKYMLGPMVAASEEPRPAPLPQGAMRVAPGTDAIVWRICPEHSGEL